MDLDQGIVVDPQMRDAEESKDLIETNMSWCAAKRTSQDQQSPERVSQAGWRLFGVRLQIFNFCFTLILCTADVNG